MVFNFFLDLINFFEFVPVIVTDKIINKLIEIFSNIRVQLVDK